MLDPKDDRRQRPALLSEGARKVELAFFLLLFVFVALAFLWTGGTSIIHAETTLFISFLPLEGLWAVLLGAVRLAMGGLILFGVYVMGRHFLRPGPYE